MAWTVGGKIVGRVVVLVVVEAGMLFVGAVQIEIFPVKDTNTVVGAEECVGTLLPEKIDTKRIVVILGREQG